jgi:hypothetical protein
MPLNTKHLFLISPELWNQFYLSRRGTPPICDSRGMFGARLPA